MDGEYISFAIIVVLIIATIVFFCLWLCAVYEPFNPVIRQRQRSIIDPLFKQRGIIDPVFRQRGIIDPLFRPQH